MEIITIIINKYETRKILILDKGEKNQRYTLQRKKQPTKNEKYNIVKKLELFLFKTNNNES